MEKELKISRYATAALAMTIFLAGFTVGWALNGQAGWMLAGNSEGSDETSAPVAQKPPPAVTPEMPSKDVPGGNIPGLPRYPDSVRIEHIREDLGDIIATEVEYLTPAELDDVREFYRDVFRTEDWYVGEVGFSRGAWTFFVIHSEREAFIELKPRGGGLVEIDIELTEVQPKEKSSSQDKPPPDKPSEPPQQQAPAQQQAPVQQPAPSQAPAPTAPASAPAQPASAPSYEDDVDDYDDYGEGGDD